MGLFLSSGCLGCADSFLFGAGKAVFRPVAWDQVRGARGRGQGTETVAQLGGLPPSLTSPIRPAVPEISPGKSLNGKERGGPKRRKSAVVPTKSILLAANVPIIGGHHVLALQS